MNQGKQFITVPEAAKRCGVGRTTFWRWVKSGEIKAVVTPGGHYRIRSEDVENFLTGKNNRSIRTKNISKAKTILIVDDDQKVHQALKAQLSRQDFRLESAFDGFQAGVKVAQNKPDLIILNIFMPGIDGFEVCRMVRDNDNFKEIKILAMTGCDTPENKERILDSGADAFLAKPVTRQALCGQVHVLLAVKK